MAYKLYSYLLSFVLLFSGIGAAYFYYKDSQKRIKNLVEVNAELKAVAQICEKTVNSLEEDIETTQRLVTVLEQKNQEAEDYKDKLITLLQRHDLTALTLKKPGLVETRVNNATKKVFEDIESITSND